MGMAKLLLVPFQSTLKTEFCTVQLISKQNPLESAIWRQKIADLYSKESSTNLKSLQCWIEDSCHLHQVLGIIGGDDKLFVWDYGKYVLPSTNNESSGAVLAIKVGHTQKSSRQVVKWDGTRDLLVGTWIDLFPGNCVSPNDPTLVTTPSGVTVYVSGCHVSSCSKLSIVFSAL
jgi:hypothetical protein